jgi:hypothetical protein
MSCSYSGIPVNKASVESKIVNVVAWFSAQSFINLSFVLGRKPSDSARILPLPGNDEVGLAVSRPRAPVFCSVKTQ